MGFNYRQGQPHRSARSLDLVAMVPAGFVELDVVMDDKNIRIYEAVEKTQIRYKVRLMNTYSFQLRTCSAIPTLGKPAQVGEHSTN